MVHPTRPEPDNAVDFTTNLRGAPGPGFYPGAGGYFHDCDGPPQRPRVVFYGTDFGTERELAKVERRGYETRKQQTIGPLRELVEEVAKETDLPDLARWCYLTNAVLAVAKIKRGTVEGNADTHKAYRKLEHTPYLRRCGETHARWLRERKPSLAVLLGAKHVEVYGSSLWSVVWPDLFGPGGKWVGLPMCEALRCPVARADAGPRVQVMYHPSSRKHWRDAREEAARLLAEGVSWAGASGVSRSPPSTP